MSSEQKIAANRLNAQKSTGPKTPEGKAKVSQNAVTHGLTAATPVLSTENPQQYNLFHENMTRQLAPEGVLECFLTERAVNLSWRLNRAQRYDTLILDTMINEASPGAGSHSERSEESHCALQSMQGVPKIENDPDSLINKILTNDFQNRCTLEKIQRYEFRIERSFYRALKELHKLQFVRLNNVTESRCTSGPLRNNVAEASSFGLSAANEEKQRRPDSAIAQNKANPGSLGSGLSSLDSIVKNKANFPLDIITQIENKQLRSRQLGKKAV